MTRCAIRIAAILWMVAAVACTSPNANAQDLASRPSEPSAEGREFFEKNIRPVLVKHCYTCHSATA